MKLKTKLRSLAVALAAAFLMVAVAGPSAYAAKGDHGVDWSRYQGAYGKWGYSRDRFSISQIGGTTDGWDCYTQWTYPTQVSSTIAAGKRAHTYIWWQNVTNSYQAEHVINTFLPQIQTPKGSIVALDVESGAQNTYAIQHACDMIRVAGYTPMVYGYKYYLTTHTDLAYLASHEQLWLAEYPDYNVTPNPNFGFFPSFANIGVFQFTSTYVPGGLDGDVDLTGITDNGYHKGNPARPQSQTPAVQAGNQARHQVNTNPATYTVRYGDSWWSIANRYGLSMYQLAAINGRSIYTTIYPGQVLNLRAVQPQPQPRQNQTTWRDALGDTWHHENGTFTLSTWINLRWGARQNSSLITTLGPGSVIKYDAYSNHGGYVWVRQPRAHGQYAYLVVRNAQNHEPFGSFK